MGKRRGARWYDYIYGRSRAYDGAIERLPWFELYCAAAAFALDSATSVLDLGCGPGMLASLLQAVSPERLVSYVGIDFSRQAIRRAEELVSDKRFVFVRRDLSAARLKFASGRAIVAGELFEHLDQDRELVAKLPGGSPLWFSVARFNARAHLRHFEQPAEVEERYGDLLADLRLVERERFIIGTAVVPRRGRTGTGKA